VVEQTLSVVGRRMPDKTGIQKVTGAARFVSDISLPGMLIGKVLHSPHAHARIVHVDTSAAERLPGVEAVVTHLDSPKKQYSGQLLNLQSEGGIEPWGVYDVRVLEDKVRYVGDAVAAVAAIDERTAEEALELIRVDYQELPAVFDEIEARLENAPQLHDSVLRRQPDGLPGLETVEGNLAVHVAHHAIGDVEQGLRESAHVIEEVGYTSKQRPAPLETLHCVADFDYSGDLTVWSVTQQPFILRTLLAYLFDIPAGRIRVKNEFTGGAFGAGLSGYREPICVLLAKKAGRPVKLVYSRQEEFVDRPTRSSMGPFAFKMGVDADGSIVAMDRQIVTAAGAHAEAAALCALVAGGSANSLYRCRHFRAEADAVYTNKSPSGAMRGFGNPEETFVREQVMDVAAERLGMDPVEFRLKNLCEVGDPGMFGPDFPLQTTGIADCLRIGAERIGWGAKRGAKDRGRQVEGTSFRRRGLGVSCMAHSSGAWPVHIDHSNATIRFNEDGSTVLNSWPAAIGTNCCTSLAQVAAEVLGLRFEDVHVVWGDTATARFEVGSYASRTMYTLGKAVELAALDARGKLLRRALKHPSLAASGLRAADAEQLELRDRRIFVKGRPEVSVPVSEVVKQSVYNRFDVEEIVGEASWGPQTSPSLYQALFAEVEVDAETGEVAVIKMVMVNDNGRSINPMTVEGQLEGGAAQGLGYALWEQPVLDAETGRVLTDDFDTYKIASALDMPDLEVILLEQPEPTGPFGAKGVGEPGCVNQAPAIANAIYDAVGVRIWSLPITPEKVLEALERKGSRA
jgi:xanthine dehydrogenase molybdenum-binding subunit